MPFLGLWRLAGSDIIPLTADTLKIDNIDAATIDTTATGVGFYGVSPHAQQAAPVDLLPGVSDLAATQGAVNELIAIGKNVGLTA